MAEGDVCYGGSGIGVGDAASVVGMPDMPRMCRKANDWGTMCSSER